eukprot:18703-Heterococcus_DN1.PRE.2
MEIIQYAKDTASTIVYNLRPESATLAGVQQKPALVLAILVVASLLIFVSIIGLSRAMEDSTVLKPVVKPVQPAAGANGAPAHAAAAIQPIEED